MESTIMERIKEIIYEIAGREMELKNDYRLYGEELGLSSLDLISLIVEIEKEFGIECPDELINKELTIGDLKECLCDLLE